MNMVVALNSLQNKKVQKLATKLEILSQHMLRIYTDTTFEKENKRVKAKFA